MFYPGIDHRTSWVNEDGVRWLNRQLHFAFWNTDAKIAAEGTTHISAWIKANGVDISPNYLREDREGGLDAVVLPDAEWERLKDRLTYEAWVEKALATERASVPASP